jgi:uncharacterized membrane protein SpoIIM required for sporulation
MLSAAWLSKRKPHWDRLEQIIQRSGRRGLGALDYAELRELGLLYRQVAADLATIREDPMSRPLTEYLNQLLGRAHNIIYMGRLASPTGIFRFYRATFPRIFRATLPYTVTAFAIFLAAGVAGFLITLGDPAFQRFFLGTEMSETIERRQMWTHSVLTIKPLASSFIMTNNLSVSFTAFALGITAGLGTVYMMATNGLLLGVVGAACWQNGLGLDLLSFVAPHGVLELPSVFIAGGGGLLIARGLLFPGSMPRRDALAFYGGEGVRLALGIVPLLVIAGLIEAFLSPSALPAAAKLVFAAALGGLFILYLTQVGVFAARPTRNPTRS